MGLPSPRRALGRGLALGSVVLALAACRAPETAGTTVRRSENGVEIVTNPKEPPAGRGIRYELRERSRIDLESEAAAAAGLGEASGLAVDSKGCVYVLAKRSDPRIYKFEPTGVFVRGFGRRGQGPGEGGSPFFFHIGRDDSVVLTLTGAKAAIFAPDGTLRREMRLPARASAVALLSGGAFAATRQLFIPQRGFEPTLSVFDASGNELRELDRDPNQDHMDVDRLTGAITRYDGAPWVFQWDVQGDSVYAVRAKRGYEIRIFDSKGALRRIIRKLCDPVPLAASWKEDFLAPLPADDPERRIIDFPAFMPALSGFMVDEQGRLFVSTYARDDDAGTYRWDVFDATGELVGRVAAPFDVEGDTAFSLARSRVRDHRVYRLSRKESGFQEIIIYEMVRRTG